MRLAALLAMLSAPLSAALAQALPSPVRQPPPTASTASAPAHTYETIGYNAGAGTSVAASNGAKNTPFLIGTVTSECSAIVLHLAGAPAQRFLIDVGIGASMSPLLVSNLYINSTAYTADVTLALNVPAGSALYVAAQASTTSQIANVSITCRVRRTGEFAGYSRYENIDPDLTATRAGSAEGNFGNTWTAVSTTTRAYSGFMIMAGQTATTGASQTYGWELGSNESGSSVAFVTGTGIVQSGAIRTPAYVSANVAKPSGTTIQFRATGPTPGDLIRVGVMGAY